MNRLDIGIVLTSSEGTRYLVIDVIGEKVKLCRIPENMTALDYRKRFFHVAVPGDATHCSLERE